MSYQKKNNQKINTSNSSISEAVALRKGLSFPAVPALQRQGAEDELQMKKIPAQLMEDEEPLQGKFNTIQKVEKEEPLQGKFETVQKVEEEEPLQGKFDTIQKVEEEEPLQGKFETAQKVEEEEPLQGKFDTIQKVEAPKDAKQNGLPGNLKSGIENLSGYSMDDVSVHYNSSKPAQLQALAYAQGTDIHIAPGQEKHLPHEAWHVAQQKQGRVKPTMQMKVGVPVNDDAGLENEADVMGAKALQSGIQLSTPLQRMIADKTKSNSGGIIQRVITTVPERYIPLEKKAKQQNPSAPITTTSEEKTDSAAAEVEPSVVEETSGSAGNEAIKKADAPASEGISASTEVGATSASAGNEAIKEKKNPQQAEIFITEAKSKKWTKEVTINGLKDMGFTSDVINVFFQEFWGDDRKRRHAVIENSEDRASKGINGMWASSKRISQNAALWGKLETKEGTDSNSGNLGKAAEFFGGINSVGKNSQGGNTAEHITDASNIAGNAGKAIVSGNPKDMTEGIVGSKNLLDDKLPKDKTEVLIGEILSTAGASIRTVINTVRLISEVKDEAKTGSTKGKIEITGDLLQLLQDSAKTAIAVMNQINTIVPTEVASLVPGLGVAVDACKLVIDVAKYYKSNQVVKQLGPEEEEEKSQLNNLLKTKNVAETLPGIFHFEERGVVFHKQKYVRLKPGIMSDLQDIGNAFHNEHNHGPQDFRTWCEKYGIYEQLKDISYQQFYEAVVAYELVSKLMEINQKREGVAANGITIGTISMAANIVKLIPADGGITAATLTAAASIGSASLKGGKWIQTKARNSGKFGGDQTRSEDNKHKEYVQLARNIYTLLSEVRDLSETDKLEKIEFFINATGANLDDVYALNGDENQQIKLLIKSMKEGR